MALRYGSDEFWNRLCKGWMSTHTTSLTDWLPRGSRNPHYKADGTARALKLHLKLAAYVIPVRDLRLSFYINLPLPPASHSCAHHKLPLAIANEATSATSWTKPVLDNKPHRFCSPLSQHFPRLSIFSAERTCLQQHLQLPVMVKASEAKSHIGSVKIGSCSPDTLDMSRNLLTCSTVPISCILKKIERPHNSSSCAKHATQPKSSIMPAPTAINWVRRSQKLPESRQMWRMIQRWVIALLRFLVSALCAEI